MAELSGYEFPGYDCCCCWGCCIGRGDNAKYIPIHDAAHATMVITATYKNNIERKRPALPLSPKRHVMFRGAYGPCGMVSQWATVLTITASADARSPTSVTMTTEERAREARMMRERALRAELERARLGKE